MPRKRDTLVTDRLAILSEMTRLRLLRLLEREELTVGELAQVMQLPQSTVSRHLKVLLENEWIVRRAEGTARRYRFVPDDVSSEVNELWTLAREQLGDTPQIKQDSNRLIEVLAERQLDSREFFGQVAGEWDAVRAELFGRIFSEQALLGLLPSEWTVADLGCGAGNVAERLAPHVKKVLAVDVSEPMLAAARTRLRPYRNVEFHQVDLLHLPLADGVADAAVISLVLHHIERPDAALAEAARILRPGGGLLVIDMLEHDRTEYRHTMGHYWLGFSTRQMEKWFEGAGLGDSRLWRLPSDPEARGPDLFACAGRKH